jgi:hypothetical protein
MLTPNTHRGQLYCRNGAHDRERHPRYAVREADVLPFVRDEIARLRVPFDAVRMAEDDDATRKALEDRRRAVGEALEVRAYSKEEAVTRIEAIEAELAALDDRAAAIDLTTVDWENDDPAAINAYLRAYIEKVLLDENMRPVDAVWRVPEWRG